MNLTPKEEKIILAIRRASLPLDESVKSGRELKMLDKLEELERLIEDIPSHIGKLNTDLTPLVDLDEYFSDKVMDYPLISKDELLESIESLDYIFKKGDEVVCYDELKYNEWFFDTDEGEGYEIDNKYVTAVVQNLEYYNIKSEITQLKEQV